ncbi:signal peptide peptidase SppA [Granulosicoccus sp. 3-233]|uniref:signal peptide peptidase SppA n=1 Tax=Granulosicoccus sp. 3-233 TaxID=3417969 RepID=UPI003D329AE6
MSKDSPQRPGIVRRFFRFLWRSMKVLNTLVFGLFSLALLAVILIAFIRQSGPDMPDGGALLLNPAGMLVEQETVVDAAALLQGQELPEQAEIRDIIDALSLAREDSRIGLVVLDLDKLHGGLLPGLQRVAEAMIHFRDGGKQLIAVADNYSQSALFLAAHADEVLLNPEGMAVPQGFSMYRTYFKDLLDEHDVTVNLFKVGKYKSAVDPFLRNDMSDEDRTARRAILDAWWSSYTSGIETARDMEPGTLDAMLNNAGEELRLAGGNLARLSQDKGLVDRLMTESQKRRYLVSLAGEDGDTQEYRKIAYRDYLRMARSSDESGSGKVAVVTAVGDIIDGEAPAGTIGSQSLIRLIRQARQADDVAAIVLRIDSGGGSKSASEMIRSELQEAQDAGIPVVASMGAVAASGGYWIASTADEIWATPTTVTGSIGIFGLLPSVENTLARHGIYSDGLATTPLAGGASVIRGVSAEYGEVLQSVIEAGYEQFLATVATGRDMEVAAVHDVAQGRIWTGEAARDIGLVDELGDLDEAVSAAARLAALEHHSVWHVEPERTVQDRLLSRLAEIVGGTWSHVGTNPVRQFARRVQQELAWMENLNDPANAYVICGECVMLRSID